jgi:transposase-like protein
MSIANIGNYLQREYGYHPSKSVVYEWIDKYTTMAVEHFKNYKPQVGDSWILDETILKKTGIISISGISLILRHASY